MVTAAGQDRAQLPVIVRHDQVPIVRGTAGGVERAEPVGDRGVDLVQQRSVQDVAGVVGADYWGYSAITV